ncbi:MAG: hypothetical protein O3B68_13560, partial [Planctomycetota bacterium]|nr:hypothetical protein [Planctomycetota bacterium]
MSKTRTRTAKVAGKQSRNPLSRKISNREAVWLNGPVPTGYWLIPENQRLYLIWLGQRLAACPDSCCVACPVRSDNIRISV